MYENSLHQSYQPKLIKSLYANEYNLTPSFTDKNYQAFNHNQSLSNRPISKNLNNDEVRTYLKEIDLLVSKTIKKDGFKSSNPIYKEPTVMETKYLKSSINMNKIQENEDLCNIIKKYTVDQQNKNERNNHYFLELMDPYYRDCDNIVGEILCINCEKFITNHEIDSHSKLCDASGSEIEKIIDDYNEQIESEKLILIINFKNFQNDGNKNEDIEIFVEYGCLIINEIIYNNKNIMKLKENFEDLKEMYGNLPEIKKRDLKRFRVLIKGRIFKYISKKIEQLEGKNQNHNNENNDSKSQKVEPKHNPINN